MDNGAELSKEDSLCLQALGWEAEAIVENEGRRFGIGVDRDMGGKTRTRHGVRVGFCAILHGEEGQRSATLNPQKFNSRITIERPVMRGSCLFTWIWVSHRFSLPIDSSVASDEIWQLNKWPQDYYGRPSHIMGR